MAVGIFLQGLLLTACRKAAALAGEDRPTQINSRYVRAGAKLECPPSSEAPFFIRTAACYLVNHKKYKQ